MYVSKKIAYVLAIRTHTTDSIFSNISFPRGTIIPNTLFVRMPGVRRIQNIALECSVSDPDWECGSGTGSVIRSRSKEIYQNLQMYCTAEMSCLSRAFSWCDKKNSKPTGTELRFFLSWHGVLESALRLWTPSSD